MEIQPISESSCIFSPVLLDPNPQILKPLQVFPQDLSLEIGEEQLAAEMRALLLYGPVDQMSILFNAEELESIYQQ